MHQSEREMLLAKVRNCTELEAKKLLEACITHFLDGSQISKLNDAVDHGLGDTDVFHQSKVYDPIKRNYSDVPFGDMHSDF